MNHPNESRRGFLKGAACMVAAGGASSFVPKLNLMGTALAQSNTSGYKALVCIYLDGGNDSWNLLIPTGTGAGSQFDHAIYTASRNGIYTTTNTGGLGVPRVATANALPPAVALTGTQLGVNPFAPELATLYNQGRLAFLSNIGTLVDPLTRTAYNARRKPPQLYSHSDQTYLWQLGGGSNSAATQGFGGNIAGIVAAPNGANLPPAISIAGQTRFLVGETLSNQPVFPYQLSTSNTQPAPVLGNYSASGGNGEAQRRQALIELINAGYPQAFSQEHAAIFDRSLDLSAIVNAQITSPQGGLTTTFPNSNIGQQLRQVARMIKISRPGFTPPAGQPQIAANRQVFYVRLGGYDTHSDQIQSATQALGHHALLQQLSQAVNAFYNAMVEIGAQNEVVLFSMSDFARTINSNGNGTDHAWGSVQFVVGGPTVVNGGLNANTSGNGGVFGRYPSMKLDNGIGRPGAVVPDQGECFSRGQMIPTMAVDQLGATLARWMGVDNANLPLVFPNIDNFATGPFANAGATPTFAYFNRVVPNLIAGIS